MFSWLKKKLFLTGLSNFLQHVLTGVGAAFVAWNVAHGVDSEVAANFWAALQEYVVAAAPILISIAWNVLEEWAAKKIAKGAK